MEFEDLFPKAPVICNSHNRIICHKCDQSIKSGATILWKKVNKIIVAEHHIACPIKLNGLLK